MEPICSYLFGNRKDLGNARYGKSSIPVKHLSRHEKVCCEGVCFLFPAVSCLAARVPPKDFVRFAFRPFLVKYSMAQFVCDSEGLTHSGLFLIHQDGVFRGVIQPRNAITFSREGYKSHIYPEITSNLHRIDRWFEDACLVQKANCLAFCLTIIRFD